jgi:Ni/Fe-hydrogenase subunit HybB-like protein
VSVLRICIEFAVAIAFSVYIIIIGCLSPCPPMLDTHFGTFLIIFSWVLTQTLFLRIRCIIAARLERFGKRILLIFGAFTMFGQFFGGILVYILIDIYKMLKEKPECVFDNSYCYNK